MTMNFKSKYFDFFLLNLSEKKLFRILTEIKNETVASKEPAKPRTFEVSFLRMFL